MQRFILNYILLITFSVLAGACSETEKISKVELINNERTKSKLINGLIFQVDYLSPKVMANRQLDKNATESERLAFEKKLQNSLNFQITILADEDYFQGDIMALGVEGYEAYKARVLDMNFNLSDWIALAYNGKTYQPVLSQLESSYGISNRRKIQLAFASEDFDFDAANNGKISLVYSDQAFNTGRNYYHFDLNKLQRL